MLAAGVALTCLGALGAGYLMQTLGSTVAVLAVARDVPMGVALQPADLTVARVNADPALRPIPADQLTALVGQRTLTTLPAGSLLTEGSLTTALIPAGGQSLVGVALTTAQLPAQPLRPGDQVRVVDTPGSQGEPPTGTPGSIAGEVVSEAGPSDSGQMVVNVTVDSNRAADLAAHAATGRVALIVDSRAR